MWNWQRKHHGQRQHCIQVPTSDPDASWPANNMKTSALGESHNGSSPGVLEQVSNQPMSGLVSGLLCPSAPSRLLAIYLVVINTPLSRSFPHPQSVPSPRVIVQSRATAAQNLTSSRLQPASFVRFSFLRYSASLPQYLIVLTCAL